MFTDSSEQSKANPLSSGKMSETADSSNLRTLIAWTAVDISSVIEHAQEQQMKNACTQQSYITKDRKGIFAEDETPSQGMASVFRRISRFSESLSRSGSIEGPDVASVYNFKKGSDRPEVREIKADRLPESRDSPTRQSSDSPIDQFNAHLNFQLKTRMFFRKNPTTENHAQDVERTLLEAYKLKNTQSASAAWQPWVHDLPNQTGHLYSLRRHKTLSEKSKLSFGGVILEPQVLLHHLKNTEFYSSEGKCLLTSASGTIFQEVVELPTTGRIFPYSIPRNLLYIYPQGLNVLGPKMSVNSIDIIVQLCSSEDAGSAIIPAFPERKVPGKLNTEASINFTFKSKSLDFIDELKIILPYNLTERHYLLFTFRYSPLSPRDLPDVFLGYSCLPVLAGGIICSGEQTLGLTPDHPWLKKTQTVDETTGTVKGTTKILDPSKITFRLKVVPVSSLHQDDIFTESIVKACSTECMEETLQSLEGGCILEDQQSTGHKPFTPTLLVNLQLARLNRLALHLIPLMDGLLRTLGVSLVKGALEPTSQNMVTIVALYVHRITRSLSNGQGLITGRNRLICQYLSGIGPSPVDKVLSRILSGYPMLGVCWVDDVVEYFHTVAATAKTKLHEHLLECLLAMVIHKTPFYKDFYESTLWFFLELLVRTFIMEQKRYEIEMEVIDVYDVSLHFIEDINHFVEEVTRDLSNRILVDDDDDEAYTTCESINHALSLFLKTLLGCLNAIDVYRFISTYLKVIDVGIGESLKPISVSACSGVMNQSQFRKIRNLELLKLELLQIITTSQEYVVLSLPEPSLLPTDRHTINDPMYLRSLRPDAKILMDPSYRRLHFLPALVISEIDACLLNSDIILQTRALMVLWNLMRLHGRGYASVDPDGQSLNLGDISALYLPLLDVACDHVQSIYTDWIDLIQKDHHVRPEICETSSLLENRRTSRSTTRPANQSPSLGHSKERYIRIGRRSTLTPDRFVLEGGLQPAPSDDQRNVSGGTNKWVYQILPRFNSSSGDPLDGTQVKLNSSVVNLLLLEVLWIIEKLSGPLLKEWLKRDGMQKVQRVCALLILSLFYSEYSYNFQPLTSETEDALELPFEATKGSPAVPLENEPMMAQSRVHREDKAGFFCLRVVSAVCKTLEHIVNASDCSIADGDCGVDEVGAVEKVSIDPRLFENIASTYVFGLSLHQCAKTFHLLCGGMCRLVSRFPAHFFNVEDPTLFAFCRALLPHCFSPLPKICVTANAAIFHLLKQNHGIHKHLFQINCKMTLALHTYLYPKEPNFDGTSAWLSTRLDTIGRCISAHSEVNPKHRWDHLLSHLPFLHPHHFHRHRHPHTISTIRQNSVDEDAMCLFPSVPANVHKNSIKFHPPEIFCAVKEFAEEEVQDVKLRSHVDGKVERGIGLSLKHANDHCPDATLRTQVEACVDSWQEILTCTLKLYDLHQQSHLSATLQKEEQMAVVDLLIRMSRGCRLVPELRQYWLLCLAETHLMFKRFDEAAQSILHALAVESEQLVNRNCDTQFIVPNLSANALVQKLMNINLLEEEYIEFAVGLPSTLPIDRYFSSPSIDTEARDFQHQPRENGFVKRLFDFVVRAAECFQGVGQYDMIPPLCQWLLPQVSDVGDHEILTHIHGLVNDSMVKISDKNKVRILPSAYFRVGFYGAAFGDLNGKEFIYKEPPLTKLAEITTRLEEFYAQINADGKSVEIVKDSNILSTVRLKDFESACIQITYVEPYLADFEMRRQSTKIGQHYGIRRFVMVTPFTLEGAAHGRLMEQYQRKIIFTTPHCFPYLNTRLPIAFKEELILTPIEVAIEDVAKRNQQLTHALQCNPPDPKFLQMVLQGCISATVNQGPVELASAFLTRSAQTDDEVCNEASDTNDEQRNELRLCLKEFLYKSQEAMQLNRKLIGKDQEEYQYELERNFAQVRQQMEPFLKPPRFLRDIIP